MARMGSDDVAEATELMWQFADRTGLVSPRPPTRYLWTDAFAVCNYLGLHRATVDERYRAIALRLVDQVHEQLGRHRDDDPRQGWLSGLPDDEGNAHPTRGGLRIGKPLRERAVFEPIDEALEWHRDGQYFHYLTKWMHALDQVTRSTGHPMFSMWARELADVAHRAFTYGPRGDKRMMWKLSSDLTRPLVPSMGQHDPIDGLVTCIQLEATAAELGVAEGPKLGAAIEDFASMIDLDALATSDPLGIGSLLFDACRLARLQRGPTARAERDELVVSLTAAAADGIEHYLSQPDLRFHAERRLAFRELGLAIGLAGVQELRDERIARYLPLRDEITSFWRRPEHRRTPAWLEHADINDVMLATSLTPQGYLVLAPPDGRMRASMAQNSHPPGHV